MVESINVVVDDGINESVNIETIDSILVDNENEKELESENVISEIQKSPFIEKSVETPGKEPYSRIKVNQPKDNIIVDVNEGID